MVNPSERHPQPGRRIRWGWFLGLAGALVVGGAAASTVHDIELGRSLLRRVPAIQTSYDTHQWAALIQELAHASPQLQQLDHGTNWVSLFEFLPRIGLTVKRDKALLSALATIAAAARDLKPGVYHILKGRALMRPSQYLSFGAVLEGARAVEAVESLPNFPQSYPLAGVNRIRRRMKPLMPLAQLITRNQHGVKALFKPSSTERFLVIFQDTGELRSTGGFMAAYGFLTFHDGQIYMQFGPDISQLANEMRIHHPAPWVLRTYFRAKKVSFINANLSPNVPDSARTIEQYYGSIPHHLPINGVIFSDSWLADQAIGALGTVQVDGTQFTPDNFYLKTEYLAEARGLPNSSRMVFLGRILQILEGRMRRSSVSLERMVPVFQKGLAQKHLLVYVNNVQLEQWLMRQNWAGTIPRLAHKNSLMVVNDNYGGLKDNYFIQSHVGLALKKLRSGQYQETVTTTWTMSGVRDGLLVGTYVGWVQCYMPLGTKLVHLTGYHLHGIRTQVYHGLGRVSFGSGILIAPRISSSAPPNVLMLKWVFLLPRLKNPQRIRVIIQPGLSGQQLTYHTAGGTTVSTQQLRDTTVNVGLSN